VKYVVLIPFCWVVPSKTADWQTDFHPTRQRQRHACTSTSLNNCSLSRPTTHRAKTATQTRNH